MDLLELSNMQVNIIAVKHCYVKASKLTVQTCVDNCSAITEALLSYLTFEQSDHKGTSTQHVA